MNLQQDFEFMKSFFARINKGENLDPSDSSYPHLSDFDDDRIEIGHSVFVPRATQVVHVLRRLKQRLSKEEVGRALVDRFRAEVIERKRPKFSVSKKDIQDETLRKIAELGGKSSYSNFQVSGWKEVLSLINEQEKAMVITAPTGAGKSEVFMLPLIYQIAQAVKSKGILHLRQIPNLHAKLVITNLWILETSANLLWRSYNVDVENVNLLRNPLQDAVKYLKEFKVIQGVY